MSKARTYTSPKREAQALAMRTAIQWFDSALYPHGVTLFSEPDDLPRDFRDIHLMALKHPVSRALASGRGNWSEIRQSRRAKRLDSIRQAVKAIGAPPCVIAEATAILLSLYAADTSWPLHDHGLPL